MSGSTIFLSFTPPFLKGILVPDPQRAVILSPSTFFPSTNIWKSPTHPPLQTILPGLWGVHDTFWWANVNMTAFPLNQDTQGSWQVGERPHEEVSFCSPGTGNLPYCQRVTAPSPPLLSSQATLFKPRDSFSPMIKSFYCLRAAQLASW